jgi:N-acetylmuramoyl-L-alanine amidase
VDRQEATQSVLPNVRALPLVTGIHHWSKLGYTRVAIDFDQTDLEKADPENADLQQTDPEKAEIQLGDPAQRVKFESQHLDHPNRIYFDLADTKLSRKLNGKSFAVDDLFLKQIRMAQFKQGRTRVVLEVEEHAVYNAFLAANPPRLIIDIRKGAVENNGAETQSTGGVAESKMSGGRDVQRDDLPVTTAAVQAWKPLVGPGAAPREVATVPVKSAPLPTIKKTIVEADDDTDDVVVTSTETKAVSKSPMIPAAERSQVRPVRSVHVAQPTANGERSLIRTLGLKIGKIVIDPGHGGHDAGTIGPNGLTEKDLVLDVSLRLGKLLESRLGAEVDYTRDDDTFIPLETRTEIANQDQADLFVSVHANSSHDSDARGVETYYLNFTTSRDALDVAARENAVSDQSIYELQDLVKKIALKEKIEESREFASDVQSALHSGLAAKNPSLRDRGVRRAPFIVLIGANMPSILAEISFVSNPEDERKLKTPEYRQRVAESLYRGIAKYVNGLSGVRVASKIDKSSGQ